MLDWRHVSVPDSWIADGVCRGQWYAIVRRHEKLWIATFHDTDEKGRDVAMQLGRGTYARVRRLCRTHADWLEAEHPPGVCGAR